MSLLGCTREKDVATLLDRGQWPHAAPAEVHAHVERCGSCSELVLARKAFGQARAAAMDLPVLPSASALWWRAQLRKRNEAIERIARPIVGAEIFAFAVVVLVAVCGVAWQLRRGTDVAGWLGALHLETLWPGALGSFQSSWSFVVPLLAALAIVSGLVVYFASEKQ